MDSLCLYRITLAIITMLFLALPCGLSAQSDTSHASTDSISIGVEGDSAVGGVDTSFHRSAILAIKHLNFDCFPDTVRGFMNRDYQFLPLSISWGRRDSLRDAPCNSDSGANSGSAHRVARTIIDYPHWRTIAGSVTIQRFNTDTLSDFLIYLWGTVRSGETVIDTARAVTIFGQQGLDTLDVIHLDSIDSFQSEPFFAMEMRVGEQFIEPAIRDISGQVSYILPMIQTKVQSDNPKRPTIIPTNDGYTVRIYPNPTLQSAQVEASTLPEGEYKVVVVAVNGQVALDQEVTVGTSGELLRTLDLHSLSSGYYIVRIYSQQKILGAYPIVITR